MSDTLRLLTIPGLLVAILDPVTSAAQPGVLEVSAVQAGTKVLIHFSISKGTTCNDTRIERADTSLQFGVIGTIPGVCGDTESDQSYSFTDSLPRQGEENLYRISLAGLEYSDTVSLFVVPSAADLLLIFPNPVGDVLNASRPEPGTATMQIWNALGKLVHSSSINGSYIQLDVSHLGRGTYLLMVGSDGKPAYSSVFAKL
jgi:hypothetical protein